jgi:hypothetical protein
MLLAAASRLWAAGRVTWRDSSTMYVYDVRDACMQHQAIRVARRSNANTVGHPDPKRCNVMLTYTESARDDMLLAAALRLGTRAPHSSSPLCMLVCGTRSFGRAGGSVGQDHMHDH